MNSVGRAAGICSGFRTKFSETPKINLVAGQVMNAPRWMDKVEGTRSWQLSACKRTSAIAKLMEYRSVQSSCPVRPLR